MCAKLSIQKRLPVSALQMLVLGININFSDAAAAEQAPDYIEKADIQRCKIDNLFNKCDQKLDSELKAQIYGEHNDQTLTKTDRVFHHLRIRLALLNLKEAWTTSQQDIARECDADVKKIQIQAMLKDNIVPAFDQLKTNLDAFMEFENDERITPRTDHNVIVTYVGGGEPYKGHIVAEQAVEGFNASPVVEDSDSDVNDRQPSAVNLPQSFGIYDEPLQELTSKFKKELLQLIPQDSSQKDYVKDELNASCANFWSLASSRLVSVAMSSDNTNNSMFLIFPLRFMEDFANNKGPLEQDSTLYNKVFFQWELPMFVLGQIRNYVVQFEDAKIYDNKYKENKLYIPVYIQAGQYTLRISFVHDFAYNTYKVTTSVINVADTTDYKHVEQLMRNNTFEKQMREKEIEQQNNRTPIQRAPVEPTYSLSVERIRSAWTEGGFLSCYSEAIQQHRHNLCEKAKFFCVISDKIKHSPQEKILRNLAGLGTNKFINREQNYSWKKDKIYGRGINLRNEDKKCSWLSADNFNQATINVTLAIAQEVLANAKILGEQIQQTRELNVEFSAYDSYLEHL